MYAAQSCVLEICQCEVQLARYATRVQCFQLTQVIRRPADNIDMQCETLLATLWKMDEPDAEIVRQRLESGDLIPAGNFRNEPASYWKEDEENG